VIAGRYELVREVGRGGMGAVWLATDAVLGRQVAIKKVGAVPGGATPDLQRAEREARLAARVNHPHVVAVFDLVSDDDSQWLVMDNKVHCPPTRWRPWRLRPRTRSPRLMRPASCTAM
jgi:serine/threonine protein kinase